MRKLLSSFDNWIISIITKLMGVFMVILTVIVFLQVLARYVFHVSIGGLGELPVFLMIISVWLTAATLARQDGHIKLEMTEMVIKNEKILKFIKLLVHILTLASVAVFTYLSYDYVKFGVETWDTTAGLKFPVWWLTSIVLISGVLMTIYYMMHLYKAIKEMGQWK